MNAAAIGVQADISVKIRLTHTSIQPNKPDGIIISNESTIPAEYILNFFFLLPNYVEGISRCEWQMSVHRTGAQKETISLSGDSTATPLLINAPKGKGVFAPMSSPQSLVRFNSKNKILTIQGALPLLEDHHIDAIELNLHYWPDKQDHLGYAHVSIKENQINSLEPLTIWTDLF